MPLSLPSMFYVRDNRSDMERPPSLFRRVSLLLGIGVWFLAAFFPAVPMAAQDENPDDIIYDRVIRKLVNDPRLKTNALEVAVEAGVVTVTGLVENEKLRARVNKILKKVKDVKKVVNQVRVRR